MFPYRHGLLRCDPMWSQLVDQSDQTAMLVVKCHVSLQWRCSECQATYHARVDNNCVASGRCAVHRKAAHSKTRPQYAGVVPPRLARPICAGLLQGVDAHAVVLVVADLWLAVNGPTDPAADRRLEAHRIASEYVREIYYGGFTRVQLLDSTFWYDGAQERRRSMLGRKRPRANDRPTAAAVVNNNLHNTWPLIVRDFRSPPWGPVWPAPDDAHITLGIRPLLDGACIHLTIKAATLPEIIAGDVVRLWPVVCGLILDLPCPLRPWRLDPARHVVRGHARRGTVAVRGSGRVRMHPRGRGCHRRTRGRPRVQHTIVGRKCGAMAARVHARRTAPCRARLEGQRQQRVRARPHRRPHRAAVARRCVAAARHPVPHWRLAFASAAPVALLRRALLHGGSKGEGTQRAVAPAPLPAVPSIA